MTQSTKDGVTTTYTYNGDGLRMSKTTNGVTTSFILDGADVVAEIKGNEITVYSRGLGLISQTKGDTTKTYFSDDHGNVTAIYSSATDGEEALYDGFGNTIFNDSSDNPFGYSGEYYDEETGLIYLRARYYDPEIGRFISEDPAMDGTNWYVYCSNNPVMFVDPTGLVPIMLRYAIEKVGGSVSYNKETGIVTTYFDNKYVEYSGEIINGRMIIDSSELATDFNLTEYYILHNAGDKFYSVDDAAMAFGLTYNRISCIPGGVEYQAFIYENSDGTFSFEDVTAGVDLGGGRRTVYAPNPDVNKKLAAWAHTHGPYPNPENPDNALDLFTGFDIITDAQGDQLHFGDGVYSHYLDAGGYVFTPGGHFKYLDYTKWKKVVRSWINDDDPSIRIITKNFNTK